MGVDGRALAATLPSVRPKAADANYLLSGKEKQIKLIIMRF